MVSILSHIYLSRLTELLSHQGVGSWLVFDQQRHHMPVCKKSTVDFSGLAAHKHTRQVDEVIRESTIRESALLEPRPPLKVGVRF